MRGQISPWRDIGQIQVSGILKKLGVRNRTEAALYAMQEGLLTSA